MNAARTAAHANCRYYEIYQEHVCGCVLRAAQETLAVLPVETVIANTEANLVNQATGHIEDQVIVSVVAPRKTIDALNMERVSAVQAMSNFVHRMDFKKLKGFAPVGPLTKDDLPAS